MFDGLTINSMVSLVPPIQDEMKLSKKGEMKLSKKGEMKLWKKGEMKPLN
jgi:hypothetical protein